MAAKKKGKSSVPENNKWYGFNSFSQTCVKIISKVGFSGFGLICLVFYVFHFVPEDQKRELTNTWLLFKCDSCNNLYIILVLALFILLLVQNYFYRKEIYLLNRRLKEITKEKSKLQEVLINKKLNSSNTNIQ